MHLLYYSFVLLLVSLFLLRCTTFCSSQSYRSAHCTSPHHTASQQYSYLNHTTFATALLFTRSRSPCFRILFLLLFVLLSGDINSTQVLQPVMWCTLNIRCMLHPLHSAALSDLIDTHNPDLFCLTETWITHYHHCWTSELHSLISTPRNGSNKISSSGGGTDISSFESSSVTLQLSHSKLSVFNSYRPPSLSTHSKPFSVFLDDFSSFLSSAATTSPSPPVSWLLSFHPYLGIRSPQDPVQLSKQAIWLRSHTHLAS